MESKKTKFQLIAGFVVTGAVFGHSVDLGNHMDVAIHNLHLPHHTYEEPKWSTYTTVLTTTMSSTTTTTTV